MSEEKTHDLYDFMQQLSDEMAAEYNRIRKRTTEDPGTAGDQGEENWAELLRGWLPRTYEVVTKGRIISQDGHTSPQVDVLVLKDVYPERLLTKKLYLAAGVAAAFECKTTLTAAHIAEAMETCVKIKNLYSVREGTPYKELHAPIVYGLLAHSHSWKGPNSTPVDNVEQKLRTSDCLHVLHPRQCLDLVCVNDLATWTSQKVTFLSQDAESITVYGRRSARGTDYRHDNQNHDFPPIGAFISNLIRSLAWEDPILRDIADYYRDIHMIGDSSGKMRKWQSRSIYSPEVYSGLGVHGPLSGSINTWSEWFSYFG